MNPTPRKKDTELATVPPGEMTIEIQSAQELMTLAISKGAGVDTLERLMDLRDRIMREEAKKAFNKAMAAFQAECPVIAKTKSVKTNDGKLAYKYAPIESAVAQVKELVQKHGFRYSTTMKFNQNKEGEKTVIAFCRVVHEMGHEEVSEMEVPMGNKTQIMSQSQVVAAASTFAKRYAFLNAFGIMTGDEDNDTASERADAPGRAPSKKQEKGYDVNPKTGEIEETPSRAVPPKKQRPPRGVPYYDPEEDDGGSITPKQRAFMTKRWGEYMDKSKTAEKEKMPALQKFVPWAFKKFNKEAALETLTIQQASYLLDFIPTLPVKGNVPPVAPPPPGNAPPPPPGGNVPAKLPTPPKKKTLSPDEIDVLHEMLREQPNVPALQKSWASVIEHKTKGELPDGTYMPLHQTMIRTKVSLEKK